jgi:hypothetical protein
MSLKFAALSSLTVFRAFGTHARADDRIQNFGPVVPHEPILKPFCRRSSATELEKSEAGGSVTNREARGATESSPPRKTL